MNRTQVILYDWKIEHRDIKKNAFLGLNFLSELCLAILKTNPEEKNNFSGVFHVE